MLKNIKEHTKNAECINNIEIYPQFMMKVEKEVKKKRKKTIKDSHRKNFRFSLFRKEVDS